MLRIMLIKVPHFGYVLTDGQNLPRFWAAAWALLIGGSLAPSTLKLRLQHIEGFYRHTEDGHPQGMLDDAIANQDLPLLEELLESYFITLRNVPDVTSGTEQRWRDAVEFVRAISERLLRTPDMSARLADITLRLERLDRLYGQLRVGKKSAPHFVRALPAAVLSELFDLVVPGAETNPFKSPATQWRAYCTFLLLLNTGLRRGEALTLRADFLKSENSPSGRQFWLNVQTSDDEHEDPRHSSPSIKTVSSIRQIPVSRIVAEAFYTYSENYRGRQKHPYFLSSMRGQPLSAEGVNHFFKILTASLSSSALKILQDRTGMSSISPHDLRHTAAVIRMKQLLTRGDSMPEIMQKMRSYFGWAAVSSMPLLYAKAAFEERLSAVWSDQFDDRVAMLMELPQ
jgi:integrase